MVLTGFQSNTGLKLSETLPILRDIRPSNRELAMSVEANVIIDESILDSYRVLQEDGEPDVVTEFIDVFLEDLPTRIERIQNAVASKAPAEIKSAAHALKGSSASVGAILVSGLCAQLEAIGRAGSAEGTVDLLRVIEPEIARAREELQKLRKP